MFEDSMQLPSFNTYSETQDLCYKTMLYLLDLQEEEISGSRMDLLKYIYYDNPEPLKETPLTETQKQQLLYDPVCPDQPPNAEKGYRIFGQNKFIETQTEMKTELRIYPALVVPINDFYGNFFIAFECICGMSLKTMDMLQDRTYNMAISIIKSLVGRNLGGIGTFFFNNSPISLGGGGNYCRLADDLGDRRFNSGHSLVLGISIGGNNEREEI